MKVYDSYNCSSSDGTTLSLMKIKDRCIIHLTKFGAIAQIIQVKEPDSPINLHNDPLMEKVELEYTFGNQNDGLTDVFVQHVAKNVFELEGNPFKEIHFLLALPLHLKMPEQLVKLKGYETDINEGFMKFIENSKEN
ncbi:hypothetical protein SNEBB_011124 [Seison nebaliae]|nr:hypothetical protein SNEBB_011124 [Seison nebaliae]